MFRLGGKLRFDQKKILPWTFRDFSVWKLASCAFLQDFGYSSFNHSSKQSSYQKMFRLLFSDFAGNSASIKTVKFYPQLFEILLFEHRQLFTICSFSHAIHRETYYFLFQCSSIAKGAIAPPPPPSIGILTKMQNKKKKHVFSTFETVVSTGIDQIAI